MRIHLISLTLITAVTAWAQASGSGPTKTYSSADEVQALIAKAIAEHKEGQATVVERILELAPYRANLEYRTSVGPAAIHEKDAELFFVIDGAATLTTGGELIDGKHTNADNIFGTGIKGGTSQHLAKGDFVIVPENTPHWFSAIDGRISLLTLHVPRGATGNTH